MRKRGKKKKKNQPNTKPTKNHNQTSNPQAARRPRSPQGAGAGSAHRVRRSGAPRSASEQAGAAPGSARPGSPGPGRSGGGGPEGAGRAGGIFSFFTKPCPGLSPGKTAPSDALQQRDPHPGARRRRRGAVTASPRAAQSLAASSPYLAFRPSSFFFQFSARCLESADSPPPRGRREPPPPARAGSGGSAGAVGARSPAEGLPEVRAA